MGAVGPSSVLGALALGTSALPAGSGPLPWSRRRFFGPSPLVGRSWETQKSSTALTILLASLVAFLPSRIELSRSVVREKMIILSLITFYMLS